MTHTDTFWLNVTNIVLGLAVVACVAYTILDVVYDRILRRKFEARNRRRSVSTHPAAWLEADHAGKEELPCQW